MVPLTNAIYSPGLEVRDPSSAKPSELGYSATSCAPLHAVIYVVNDAEAQA
jgi:hypothetical protein